MFSLKKLSWKRIYYKIVSQEGTPESIARAAAIGLATGFLIPVGFQTFVVFPLAFIFKANKVLSFFFTMVTNPYNAVIIYPLQCYLGSLIMFQPMKLSEIEMKLKTFLSEQTFENLRSLSEELLIPFFVGGAALALVSAPIGYFASYGIVQRYRERKEKRLRKRLAKRNRLKEKSNHSGAETK